MRQSESIGKLAEALAAAQSEFTNAIKDSKNPFFNSTYADITSVFDACRQPLCKFGLSIAQPLSYSEEGKPIIETILMHVSGEWIAGQLILNPTKQDPQGIGSAITYGRRFSLESMLGIAREEADDDGNAASERQAPAPVPPPGAAKEGGADEQAAPPPPPKEDEVALREHLFTLCKALSKAIEGDEKKWPGILEDLTSNPQGKYGVTKLSEVAISKPLKAGGTWSPLKAAIEKAEKQLDKIAKEDAGGDK